MNKVLVINPTELERVSLINYENDNVVNSSNKGLSAQITSKDVKELQRKANEVERELLFEDKGVCYISGEKDIKQCTISFGMQENCNVTKRMIKYSMDYAFETLGMETIFIKQKENDQKLEKILETLDFINLGEVDGNNVYLKEKTEKEIVQITSNHRINY